MTDFNELRIICKEITLLSSVVVDDFLIYYAASRDKLELEFDKRFYRYRHVAKSMPKNWVSLLKSQYIGYRIFRKEGLIQKYLKHVAVKGLDAEQQEFLARHAKSPWSFSFSVISGNPDEDFYEMEDVFTGGKFLLYSPSISNSLKERPIILWFNLIAFNGSCWQTYGPVTGYQSFSADDIFYFATELHPMIKSYDELLIDMGENPVPYMMLAIGSLYPRTFHGQNEFLQVQAENPLEELDTDKLGKDFRLDYALGVFRISHPKWNEFPHLAAAYFDESREIILLSAYTDKGFEELVKQFNRHGYSFPPEPYMRIHVSMNTAIRDIFKKVPTQEVYEDLFIEEPSAKSKKELDKLNKLLAMALPYINEGKEPDVEALAKKSGVGIETARDLLGISIGRIKKLRGGAKGNPGK